MEQKLKLPERYYPPDVEAAITAFLQSCVIELHPTSTDKETRNLEDELIERLNPRAQREASETGLSSSAHPSFSGFTYFLPKPATAT